MLIITMHDNITPASGYERLNDVTLIDFVSVDSALDFDTSNQSKLNYWGRDFHTNLLVNFIDD